MTTTATQQLTVGDSLRKLADIADQFPAMRLSINVYTHPRNADDLMDAVNLLDNALLEKGNGTRDIVYGQVGRITVGVFIPAAAMVEPTVQAKTLSPELIEALGLPA